ncbi:hypothetical protein HOY82DRAFT_191568 [Tuber indicum]|nr:hypothetical protein HOY82DRAFT_191568 [Tuber indicum]
MIKSPECGSQVVLYIFSLCSLRPFHWKYTFSSSRIWKYFFYYSIILILFFFHPGGSSLLLFSFYLTYISCSSYNTVNPFAFLVYPLIPYVNWFESRACEFLPAPPSTGRTNPVLYST